MSGQLIVIATPLGNLEDLSPRALEALRSVDCIACEDTRRTARLLARYEVKTPTLSCHKFNEGERLDAILARLRAGERIALVSDGGTPGVADPGALLVRHALDAGIAVMPIPGPSAVATLLSASGMPADRYVFDGFLPHRAGERRRRLRELLHETRTVVLFETPHRIREALEDIREVLGDRPLVLGRELTKLHETILRGTAASLLERLGPAVRGEIALVLGGATAGSHAGDTDTASKQMLDCWHRNLDSTGGDRRQALKRSSRELGIGKSELYRRLAELGETVE